jgi:hypothetical protein
LAATSHIITMHDSRGMSLGQRLDLFAINDNGHSLSLTYWSGRIKGLY